MIEEKFSRISKEKAEVETLLRDANKEFPNDDNVKKLFEQYKGFFKETILLKEMKAQEASQNVKPKPAAVKTNEAAEKPKPVENVKELAEKPKKPAEKAHEAPQNVNPKPTTVKTKEAAKKPKPTENVKEVAEKPKEPAEKAQEAPQYVKPKPAAVKTNEAAEKPMPTENVKELAEKPKEPAEKAQEAPQYVKPKPAAVKTNEAAEKPMPTENVKELAKKPKEPAGDDYQVVPAATVMKAEDREEFKVETFTQGVTIEDRTLDLRVEPLEHGQSFLYYQEFQLKVTNHHEDKISLIQPITIPKEDAAVGGGVQTTGIISEVGEECFEGHNSLGDDSKPKLIPLRAALDRTN
nr:hypothetical protein CTI12_AA283080 [Tanacetum cinerariifolium]